MGAIEDTKSKAQRTRIKEEGNKAEAETKIMGAKAVEKVADTGEKLKKKIQK